jgi:Outer membrane protein beta-barrel domain
VSFAKISRRCCPIVVLIGLSADAAAQPTAGPIGRFVVDARGTLARFKANPAVAEALDVDATTLPTRGLGITVGAHWYPLRMRRITFGVGAEYARAGDGKTTTVTGVETEGPTLTTRFTSLSPQLSLNFGRDEGWSYVSAGMGTARITTERADSPLAGTADRTRALNYGGGARWFNSPRMAFTFDVRFYAISPRPATATVPGYPRAKFMVLSAGVAFR